MRLLSSRVSVIVFVGLALAAFATSVTARAPQGGNEKSIYALVMDAQNKPVKGFPAEGFAIREDNIDRQVVGAKVLTDPMAVVLLADTTSAFAPYPRDLRDSTAAFIKRFLSDSPQSSVALWEFGGADIPIENFTSDAVKLEAAVPKLFPKGTLSETDLSGSAVTRGQNIVGSNLLEAFITASKQLAKRPEPRKIIVSFNSDFSVENSKVPGQQVQDEVMKAGVSILAVSIQAPTPNGPLRDNVLDQLTPYSGGKRFTINNVQALAATLENVADLLAGQYVVTYVRPSGSAKLVQIGSRAPGIFVGTNRFAPK